MAKSAAVSELKGKLSQVLREVEVLGEPVVIERRGRPIAIIVPFEGNAETTSHWTEQIDGVVAGIHGFDDVMRDVVDSRGEVESRDVDLDS